MKTYIFKFPFQGNRKGDIVTEDKHGQLLVKAGSNNVMWGPKDVFRAESMGLMEQEGKEATLLKTSSPLRYTASSRAFATNGVIADTLCAHPSPRRENDELYCEVCKKRWEANER